jgi:hypothetical protein
VLSTRHVIRVQEAFQTGKGLTGLDEHQVRRYTPWARWTVLALLAHAFLTIVAAEQPRSPATAGMISVTRNEIAHLLAILLFTPTCPDWQRWAWSAWRRRYQLTAKHCHCHCQRQGAQRS